MTWSDKQKAYDLARDAKGINEAVSNLMKFCVGVTEERDELKIYKENIQSFITGKSTEVRKLKSQLAECKRQRDEALGKSPLYEKNKAEAEALSSEDFKPALVLALCQLDIAMRSVIKIQAISKLLNVWNNQENSGDGSVEADADLISEVNRIIKKGL